MWGAHDNESGSEDFSDKEYVAHEDKEDWSLSQIKFMEFTKKEGKTIFDVGKCGKFCFEIKFPSYGRQEVKLSLLTPCPMWIRNTSEIEDGKRKYPSSSDGDSDDEACFKVARVLPRFKGKAEDSVHPSQFLERVISARLVDFIERHRGIGLPFANLLLYPFICRRRRCRLSVARRSY